MVRPITAIAQSLATLIKENIALGLALLAQWEAWWHQADVLERWLRALHLDPQAAGRELLSFSQDDIYGVKGQLAESALYCGPLPAETVICF